MKRIPDIIIDPKKTNKKEKDNDVNDNIIPILITKHKINKHRINDKRKILYITYIQK